MNNRNAAADIHRLVDLALARGCDISVIVFRDGVRQGGAYLVNRQRIEIIDTEGTPLPEAA